MVNRTEENTSADLFFLTLGIIPHVFSVEYSVYYYNLKDQKYLIKNKNKGNVVLSLFFVPFFFLHKSDHEIVADQISLVIDQINQRN